MGLLDGFEAMSLVPKKGDSILSVSKSIIRFNKATAAELGYPDNVKLLVNVKTSQVAVQACSEKDPSAIKFCNNDKKHSYAIFVKIPALLAEFRRLLSFENDVGYSMEGTTYPEEKAIIYNLKEAKQESGKWTGKKKKTEDQTEEPKRE